MNTPKTKDIVEKYTKTSFDKITPEEWETKWVTVDNVVEFLKEEVHRSGSTPQILEEFNKQINKRKCNCGKDATVRGLYCDKCYTALKKHQRGIE